MYCTGAEYQVATFARVLAIYKYEAGSQHEMEGRVLLLCEWLEGFAAQDQMRKPAPADQQNAYLHPSVPQYPCMTRVKAADSAGGGSVNHLTTVALDDPGLLGIRWIVLSCDSRTRSAPQQLLWLIKNDGLETHQVYGNRLAEAEPAFHD